ncbi:MAG: hypothetical protein WBW89_04550, partial [Candidatus Cybelea sp.]
TNQSALTSDARFHPAAASPCPGGGIHLVQGNNGTYTVAIGASCDMYAPYNTGCSESSSPGETYTFMITSGFGLGTLKVEQNEGTFKRTGKGEVVITIQQAQRLYPLCKPTYSTWATIHLTTPAGS